MEKRDEQAIRTDAASQDPWRVNDEARKRRLREDGCRSLATNLAEGLALTEYLSKFTGSARGL